MNRDRKGCAARIPANMRMVEPELPASRSVAGGVSPSIPAPCRTTVSSLRSIATPGHTVGHTSYLVESKGQRLMVIGDLIHVAAVQFPDPGVTIAFDSDAPAAAATRKKVFGEIASDGVLLGAEHLQFPALGHLSAAGKSWRWVPVNYSTQLR